MARRAVKLEAQCIGIAAASGVFLIVWDAAHSIGLLVDPFSVPPTWPRKA